MCFKPRSKYCNLNQPLLQTKTQKCYCHFFITEHAFTCLPFHFFKVSLGGSSKPIQHPLLLTVECLEVGQVLAAHYFPGGPRSVTQDSPATPSFLESLAGWWPPFRRARADVAPPRAHQPQPGLTGGVTQVQAGSSSCMMGPPARESRAHLCKTTLLFLSQIPEQAPGVSPLRVKNASGLGFGFFLGCWITTDKYFFIIGGNSVIDSEILWLTRKLWFWRQVYGGIPTLI